MKKLFFMIAAFLLLFSCQPDDVSVDSKLTEVSFSFANLTGNKSSDVKAKSGDNKSSAESIYPACSEEQPFDAEVTIDGTVYVLNFTALNTGETEVLQLPLDAPNIVQEVVVYDENGVPIYESPSIESPEVLEAGLVGVPLKLNLRPFHKSKVHIDVVCYQNATYQTLTWAWFDIDYYRIKEVCFFGDVCTKYFEEFHKEGSPYFGQDYEGYDFPAIFEVQIINDTTGDVVIADNVDWLGEGSPLCIEYIDNLQVTEDFRFVISLFLPDGTKDVVYEASLEDGIFSEAGNPDGFGGEDGIFVFNVGNCNSTGQNDIDVAFPAYLPLPDQAKFKIFGTTYANGYLSLEVSGVSAGTYVIDNEVYEGWCGSKFNSIQRNVWYNANVYNSLGGAVSAYSAEKLGMLNWIANHTDGHSNKTIQKAIWAVVDGTTGNSFSVEASSHSDYVPQVGGYAFVIFDPIEAECQGEIQIFIVRIDP